MKKAKDYFLRNVPMDQAQLEISKSNALKLGEDFDIVEATIDRAWAQMVKNSGAPNPYYDYFYTGQDIQVYMAEVSDKDPEFGTVPIVALAFNIAQEKRPVYGFWDYSYSAVMRGTRLVSGQFSIVTKHPNYMRNMIAKSAHNRSNRTGNLADPYPAASNLTEDDSKIQYYWGKHLDPAYLAGAGNQEFSIHPPFSLVIVYGVQEPDCADNYGDQAMFSDVNHRLVDSSTMDPTRPNKIILDACELMSCNRSYSPDGQALVETYEFFARDCITPQ